MIARRRRGTSLPEALVTTGLLALLLAGAAAVTGRAYQRSRAPAATRAAVSEIRRLRSAAIARGRHLGLQFSPGGAGGWSVAVIEDGDGDGLRTDDLRRGIDIVREPARPCRDRWGVSPGFARGLETLRSPPPENERLPSLADPVRFGTRDIISCSPRGVVTGGTLYLTDGSERQMAVVVAASTARVRAWEYRLERRSWVLR